MEEALFDYVINGLRGCGKPLKLVAEETGVSYFTMQKWLRSKGTRNPRIKSVEKVANYLRNQAAVRS